MVAPREWELADYTWCERTGIGTYTYERERVDTGELETRVVKKAQPHHPTHTGWYIEQARLAF